MQIRIKREHATAIMVLEEALENLKRSLSEREDVESDPSAMPTMEGFNDAIAEQDMGVQYAVEFMEHYSTELATKIRRAYGL